MAKCIYTKKTEKDTEFKKREHIFPAGIGGSKMLPQGDVSDYANEVFSKLELNFMRESILSIPRTFFGPGKRGSLSQKKRTKSKISLMKVDNSNFLGYIELGVPKSITQVQINYNYIKDNKKQNLKFSFPKDEDINKNFEGFIKKLNSNRYIKIIVPNLEINSFIVGYYNNKMYIAYNPNSEIEKFSIYLKNDFKVPKELLEKELKKGALKEVKNNPNLTLNLSFNIREYNRVCAKIAFNALCYLKGADFVLKEEFDDIREFIINDRGLDKEFVQLQGKQVIIDVKNFLKITNLQHYILFSKSKDNKLCAILSLYGTDHLVLLSNNYSDNFIVDGFICDWKNKNETSLINKLAEHCN